MKFCNPRAWRNWIHQSFKIKFPENLSVDRIYQIVDSRIFFIDVEENLITNQSLVYDFKPFFSDGFRCDKDGNIWTSAGKAIKCFNKSNVLEKYNLKNNINPSKVFIKRSEEFKEFPPRKGWRGAFILTTK